MATCDITNGRVLGCTQQGGVKRVYLGTWDEGVTFTLGPDNVITTVLTGTPTVYLYSQEVQAASLTQAGTHSRENLSEFKETLLAITLFGLDAGLLEIVNNLVRAGIIAVVELMNGTFVYLGYDFPGRVTESNVQAGKSLGDMNGATLTISFLDINGMHALDTALLGAVDGIVIAPTV